MPEEASCTVRLNKDDTMDFVAKKFGIEILEAA